MKPKPNTAFLREMDAKLKLALGEAVSPGDVVDGPLGPAVPPTTCDHCGKSGEWQQGNAHLSDDAGGQTLRVEWRHVPCGKITYQ